MNSDDVIRAIECLRKDVSREIKGLGGDITEIKISTAKTAQSVESHEESLYGEDGVCKRLTQVEVRQVECPARSTSKVFRSAVITAIVSAVIGGVIVSAVQNFTASAKPPQVTTSK